MSHAFLRERYQRDSEHAAGVVVSDAQGRWTGRLFRIGLPDREWQAQSAVEARALVEEAYGAQLEFRQAVGEVR